MTIKLKFFNYLFVLVCLIMGTGMSMHAEEQTFTRINSIEELNDGDRFIVVNEELSKAISTWNGVKYFNFTDILIDNGVATTSNIVTILTLEKTTSTKYYYLKTADGFYLSNGSTPSSANVTALKSIPDNTSMATIAIDKTHAEIVFENKVKKAFLFAEGTGFSCYDYTYHDASRRMLAIYKADGSQSAIKQTTFVTFSSKDLTIYKGKEYSLPTASVTRQKGETIADAKLSYSSSNEKVASVNKYTGEITLKEFGTTTITAKYAGSDLYKESEGSYTLTYQDRLSEATIVFSAENEAFYNMPKNSDNHALPQNCIFMSDNGEEYKFKIYCFYKHRVNKGFLTSISGDAKVTSPEFLAPNGYVVRVVFEQKYNGSRPYISSAAQTNYIKNGEGTLTALNEYEFTETIPDSKPFTITSTTCWRN